MSTAALPAPPVLGTSFTAISTNNPTQQQPGPLLDAEFNRTNSAVNSIIQYLKVSVNADGTLSSAAVETGYEQALAAGLITGSPTTGNPGSSDVAGTLNAALSQAWAEYMPDQLPASVLSTQGITGSHYSARYWAAQAALPPPASTPAPASTRNYVHNPRFNVAQRGPGPFVGAVAGIDRWPAAISDASQAVTTSIAPLSPTLVSQIGDETATGALAATFTGHAIAGGYVQIIQPIESIKQLSNKTITVSFYAAAQSGSMVLGLNLRQIFGTGGSPSAPVDVAGQSVTLTGTFTRYSRTFLVPSAVAKVLGTNSDAHTQLAFWLSGAPENVSPSGGVPVQADTFYLWGVQIETGTTASPLENREYSTELQFCQRTFQTAQIYGYGYTAAAGAPGGVGTALGVQMRATPTALIVPGSVAASNLGTLAAGSSGPNSAYLQGTTPTAGGYFIAGTLSLSAEF